MILLHPPCGFRLMSDLFSAGRYYRRKDAAGTLFMCARNDMPGSLGGIVFVDLRGGAVVDAERIDPVWFDEVKVQMEVVE